MSGELQRTRVLKWRTKAFWEYKWEPRVTGQKAASSFMKLLLTHRISMSWNFFVHVNECK